MSRLNTLWEHGPDVRDYGAHGRGYIPNYIYETKVVPFCEQRGLDTLPLVIAMIELIIDEGLNQCLD